MVVSYNEMIVFEIIPLYAANPHGGFNHSLLLTRRFQVAFGEENEVSRGMPQKHISKRQDIRKLFGITIFLPHQ